MTYKNVLIVFFLFVCIILSISSASASDLNDNITSANTEDDFSINEEIKVSNEIDEEILGDGNVKTFSQLQNNISQNYGSTITLNNDYEWDDSFSIYGIAITQSITIDGQGHKIDAKGKSRIFNINGNNVVLKNIKFINGTTTDDSTDNRSHGGSILWLGSNGEISNCTFTNNNAHKWGGAIHWNGNNGHIFNCVFKGNAANYGGAVNINSVNSIISNCSFTNNIARLRGGAICLTQGNGTVSECNFINNYAYEYGSGIYLIGQAANIFNCNFTNHETNKGNIYLFKSDNTTISQCFFINNSYTSNDGAIYWSGINGKVTNCSFINNSLPGYGAAIYWYGSNGEVSDCIFINNCANFGSGIYWKTLNGLTTNCIFINNIANQGGVVEWEGSQSGIISSCIFVNNTAKEGIVYFNGQSSATALNINHNIFLNNKGNNIKFANTYEQSNTDYNWYGNNASDFKNTPTASNSKIWLFLNGTSNPEEISFSTTSDVIFKLYAYSPTEGVSDYDNALLKDINLTATSIHGKINASSIKLGEPIKYTPSDIENGIVTAKIENIQSNIEIPIKSDSNLSVRSQEVIYKDNITVTLSYNSQATGKVNITLKSKTKNYTFNNIDLNTTLLLSDVDVGEYEMIINYLGDDKFFKTTANATLTVTKSKSTLNVSDIVFDYNSVGLSVISFAGAYGISAFVVNHSEADVNVTGNEIIVGGLNPGKYTLNVTTLVDGNHESVTATALITVNKLKSFITLSEIIFDYGKSGSSIATLTGAINITAYVIGHNEADVNINGNEITVSSLNAGTYTLNVTVIPDIYHEASSNTTTITVNKINSTITLTPITFDYGKNGTTTTTSTGASTLTARVNGHDEANININNNIITVSNLNAGTYTLNVTTVPDSNHLSVSNTTTITVNKAYSAVVLSEIVYDVGDVGRCEVTLIGAGDFTAHVVDHDEAEVNINGNEITVSSLNAGTYTLNVTTIPDNNHKAVSNTTTITVNKAYSAVVLSEIIYDVGDVGRCEVTLIGAGDFTAHVVDHDEAEVNINGNEITVSSLNAGTYTLNVTTIPDNNHKAVSNTTTITVNKINSTITLTPITFDYGKNGTTTITSTGTTTITAKVTGHEEANINIEGNTITVSNLNAGTYTLNVTTVPDNNHKAVSNTTTITVNKINSTITLTPITFDYGKNGTALYTSTGATTITAKVTGHEEAIIKIENNQITVSNLNAGTYTLNVTTVPDSNHLSVNSTTTITVNKVDCGIILNGIVFNINGMGICEATLIGALNITAYVVDHDEAIINIDNNKITVSSLDVGTYILNVIANPDSNHKPTSNTTTITVNKDNSAVLISPIVFDYGSSGESIATLTYASTVTANVVNHTEAVITIKNNIITISGLNAGNYILNVTTVPDNDYTAVSTTTNITVNKVKTQISANSVTAIYNTDQDLIITLKDNTEKPIQYVEITVNLNGVKTFTTNSNGQVKISTKGLSPNTYITSIAFSGNTNYIKSDSTVKVIVKKATPKLAASKKTFKVKVKIKKYTVTLKDNKGKGINKAKVTLKVKGKTYSAKTISNGKATFKITKLTKKGTYKAVIKYNGNRYYNKVSKKITIKIR